MKILAAVVTAHKYDYKGSRDEQAENGRVKIIRETWANLVTSDVTLKFFYGKGGNRSPQADEVFLDVPDDYQNLAFKVIEIYRWALRNDYEFVLKIDDDTFVNPRVFKEFANYDYAGNVIDVNDASYASGFSYWVSRKAMECIVNEPLTYSKELLISEDRLIGTILNRNGIFPQNDSRYQSCFCDQCLFGGKKGTEGQKFDKLSKGFTVHCPPPFTWMCELNKRV
jgi:hypothetical protein